MNAEFEHNFAMALKNLEAVKKSSKRFFEYGYRSDGNESIEELDNILFYLAACYNQIEDLLEDEFDTTDPAQARHDKLLGV